MEFQKFNKITRLSRECVVTEKIDGTNAQVAIFSGQTLRESYSKDVKYIMGMLPKEAEEFIEQYSLGCTNYKYRGLGDQLFIFAASRNRWLTSENDNYGFAKWVERNSYDLLEGLGEGRHYGEWWGSGIQRRYNMDKKIFSLFNVDKWNNWDVRPMTCNVVPVLYEGMFDTKKIDDVLQELKEKGSVAAPGYMNPEGIVIYHKHSRTLFKKTLDKNDEHKG